MKKKTRFCQNPLKGSYHPHKKTCHLWPGGSVNVTFCVQISWNLLILKQHEISKLNYQNPSSPKINTHVCAIGVILITVRWSIKLTLIKIDMQQFQRMFYKCFNESPHSFQILKDNNIHCEKNHLLVATTFLISWCF